MSQSQINLLTELQNYLNEAKGVLSNEEDHSKLLAALKGYSLSKEEREAVLAMVAGKAKLKAASSKAKDEAMKKLEAFATVAGVKLHDREGNFLGLEKLKQKVSIKKSTLKRKAD